MFEKNPKVTIIKEIDTADKWWCDSAVLFSVKNGKNTISERFGPTGKDYDHYMQLQLNGKPLVQGELPLCPTCKGMLATGYGIENVDCPELEAARTCMNSSFVSIMDSAEKIKPLLGLLDDGYYALADTVCFPSDGDSHFFYDVPNELKLFDATCYGYYCNWDYSCVYSYPMFLYPTQSASLINNERVEHYAQIMKTQEEPPRALAYHLAGFMNALLDGHHKACAAASLGKSIRCLTIIPCDSYSFKKETIIKGLSPEQSNPEIEILRFTGLETKAPQGVYFLDLHREQIIDSDISFQKYDLTDNKIRYGTASYPTIRDIATLSHALEVEGLLPDLDLNAISKLMEEDTENTDRYLEAILHWLSSTDPETAYKLAVSIARKGPEYGHNRLRSAFLYLLNFKNEETEELFVDYYIKYGEKEHDDISDIVNSYWNRDKI